MTTVALMAKEIGRLKDVIRDKDEAIRLQAKCTKQQKAILDYLITDMKESQHVPTDVHNYIVLTLLPRARFNNPLK